MELPIEIITDRNEGRANSSSVVEKCHQISMLWDVIEQRAPFDSNVSNFVERRILSENLKLIPIKFYKLAKMEHAGNAASQLSSKVNPAIWIRIPWANKQKQS